MTEEQLQAIKERAERVDPNRYDANNSFHSQLDVPALIAEVELQKANAEQYLQDNVELHNENLILNNEVQRLREIIINAGCAMAEGENGDAYRHLYNGIGNGDYNYFERINEEEEKKFSEAIKRRLDGETK